MKRTRRSQTSCGPVGGVVPLIEGFERLARKRCREGCQKVPVPCGYGLLPHHTRSDSRSARIQVTRGRGAPGRSSSSVAASTGSASAMSNDGIPTLSLLQLPCLSRRGYMQTYTRHRAEATAVKAKIRSALIHVYTRFDQSLEGSKSLLVADAIVQSRSQAQCRIDPAKHDKHTK